MEKGSIHSSSTTVTGRRSFDLSFLLKRGFDVENFVQDGTEEFIFHVEKDDQEDFMAHAEQLSAKLRVSCGKDYIYVKRPSMPHEMAVGAICAAVYGLNFRTCQQLNHPIKDTRSTRRLIPNHGYFEPDSSFQVVDRIHSSPNLVAETRHRNLDQNYAEWFQMLRNYFDADDIMVVIGLIILPPVTPEVQLSLVFVMYTRPVIFNPATWGQPTELVSFGTHRLHGNSLNPIQDAAQFNMRGVGIGADPPCDANSPYLIRIDANLLLRQDNFGNVVPFLVLNLFDIQSDIIRGFAWMHGVSLINANCSI